jgi:hypothetical protein
MKIDLLALLSVVVVSFGAGVGIVGLVAVALLGWSARPAVTGSRPRPATLSPAVGTVAAVAGMAVAVAIVGFGLWQIVVR